MVTTHATRRGSVSCENEKGARLEVDRMVSGPPDREVAAVVGTTNRLQPCYPTMFPAQQAPGIVTPGELSARVDRRIGWFA